MNPLHALAPRGLSLAGNRTFDLASLGRQIAATTLCTTGGFDAISEEWTEKPAEVDVDARIVEEAVESPNVVPEASSVEITPGSELDPSITALEPELASKLDRRADEAISEAAACESPVVQPANPGPQLSDEVLHGSHPAATTRGPGPTDVQVADAGRVCMRSFPAVALSVAGARSFAVHALADIPADVLDDIRLMVSELASNAIEHAKTGFHLTIHRNWQEIRVEVTDSGAGTPAMRTPGPDALKGRGLQIVNTVSTDWGVEQDSHSAKTVWFTRAFAPIPTSLRDTAELSS